MTPPARGLAVLLAVLWAGAAWVGLALVGEDPASPHAFMDDEHRCAGCHRVEKEGEDWVLDPHLFTISVVEACRGCHPGDQLGRSHPVEVDPYRLLDRRSDPIDLPLHWSEDQRADVMTCGTCHNPHLPRHSDRKLHGRQRPDRTAGGAYLTYFLRKRGERARDGYMPLCHSCHPDL